MLGRLCSSCAGVPISNFSCVLRCTPAKVAPMLRVSRLNSSFGMGAIFRLRLVSAFGIGTPLGLNPDADTEGLFDYSSIFPFPRLAVRVSIFLTSSYPGIPFFLRLLLIIRVLVCFQSAFLGRSSRCRSDRVRSGPNLLLRSCCCCCRCYIFLPLASRLLFHSLLFFAFSFRY